MKLKKNVVISALCMVLLSLLLVSNVYATSSSSQVFIDVDKNHWASEGIEFMTKNEIIKGYAGGYFNPAKNISREEFATLLVKALNIRLDNDYTFQTFKDVDFGRWSFKFIESTKGIVVEYDEYTNAPKVSYYKPTNNAVREDMAAALVRALSFDTTKYNTSILKDYSDASNISDNLVSYVAIAIEKGIMSGYPVGEDGLKTFKPQGELTRAEAAMLFLNALKIKGDIAYENGSWIKFKKAEDYIPFVKDQIKIYREANYEFEVRDNPHNVDYIVGNKMQISYSDGGTNNIEVYEKGNDVIKLGYPRMAEDAVPGYYLDQEIDFKYTVLQGPIKLNQSWKNGEKITKITAIDKKITVNHTEYTVIEVSTEEDEGTLRKYYAKDVGLIKTEFEYREGLEQEHSNLERSLKSELIKIVDLSDKNTVFKGLNNYQYIKYIDQLKRLLEDGKKAEFAKKIVPLQREYPVSDIKTEAEFIVRYDQVFDDNLVKAILRSSSKYDWTELSSRYLRLNSEHGVWLDLEGNIIKIDYVPEKGREYEAMLLEEMKENLHSTLHEFISPVLYMETKGFKVRIDKTDTTKYRYASWGIDKSTKEQPDLVIENGVIESQGSGGNHAYVFTRNAYKYKVDVVEVGNNETDFGTFLLVEEGEELLMKQKAITLYK